MRNINTFHSLNSNESGNMFDYNFFNNYYFESIYIKEAEFFLDIKTYDNIEKYQKKLENIIDEEKKLSLTSDPVNKFKKINGEPLRRCIKSRIFDPIDA